MSSAVYRLLNVVCLPPSECIIDLVLIVDESGSIAADTNPFVDNWERFIKPFIFDLTNALNIGSDRIRIGMIMFNQE